jgi:hypothetical protein
MTDKTEDLKSPGGSYTATPTFAIGDKTGTEYNTSMSAAGGSFGINVWRIRPGKPAELIITKPGCHGTLMVVHRKLWFYWNTADKPLGKQKRTLIEGYIHETDTVSGTIVNINDSQVEALRQQIRTAQDQAGAAQRAAISAEGKSLVALKQVEDLTKRVAKLEQAGVGQNVSEQKIADIVWAKLWDAFYLIRMGMNEGGSKDPNIQGWITDLASFIRRVK